MTRHCWGIKPSRKERAAVTTDRFLAALRETEAVRQYEKELELAEVVEHIARHLTRTEVAYA